MSTPSVPVSPAVDDVSPPDVSPTVLLAAVVSVLPVLSSLQAISKPGSSKNPISRQRFISSTRGVGSSNNTDRGYHLCLCKNRHRGHRHTRRCPQDQTQPHSLRSQSVGYQVVRNRNTCQGIVLLDIRNAVRPGTCRRPRSLFRQLSTMSRQPRTFRQLYCSRPSPPCFQCCLRYRPTLRPSGAQRRTGCVC